MIFLLLLLSATTVDSKLSIDIVFPKEDKSPRLFSKDLPIDILVGAAVNSTITGSITVEIVSNGLVLQGTNAFVRKGIPTLVWLMLHNAQSLARREFAVNEDWTGDATFRVEAIMESPERSIEVKDVKFLLRHLPLLVKSLPQSVSVSYPKMPVFDIVKNETKNPWWRGHPGADVFNWPFNQSTIAALILDIRGRGVDHYISSLIPHGDWVVAQGDTVSGTEIQHEVARMQACREELLTVLAVENLKNRTDIAEKEAGDLDHFEKVDPKSEHNILREMMGRVSMNREEEIKIVGKTKKRPKRREEKDRPRIERTALCIAGSFTHSVDEFLAVHLKASVVSVFEKESAVDVFVVAASKYPMEVQDFATEIGAVEVKVIDPEYVDSSWESIVPSFPLRDGDTPMKVREKSLKVLRRFYAMETCSNVTRDYALSRSIQYNMYARMRPDLYFPEPVPPLSSFNRAAVSVNARHSFGGYNDRFVVSPMELVESFEGTLGRAANIVPWVPPKSNFNGFLSVNVMQFAIPVVRRFDFWFCRIRGSDGAYEVEDNDCPATLNSKLNKLLSDSDEQD